MRKVENSEVTSGRIYDISDLSLKTVQNEESKYFGTQFITGSLDVATDEECLNIVTIKFNFLRPVYNSGKSNETFTILKNMIENGVKTVVDNGKEEAEKIQVTGSIGLNDFYTKDSSGELTLVSAKINSGSFVQTIKVLPKESERSKFTCDMLINGVKLVEAKEENEEDYLVVKGAIFDFRKAILPIEFHCKDKDGIRFFENLEPSANNLIFTRVWGTVVTSQDTVKKVTESAFGGPVVEEHSRSRKEMIITRTYTYDHMYEVGDAATGITVEEIQKALEDREVYLASVKKRAEDYQASKEGGNTAKNVASAPAAQGGFNF